MKYKRIQFGLRYLSYYFSASNGKGHGIHSPYVFDFVTRILNDDRSFYAFSNIASLHNELKKELREIRLEDIGAYQSVNSDNTLTVNSFIHSKNNLIKYGQLLFRMVDYYAPENILVLGTSLGISTAYLAAANSKAHIFAIESVPQLGEIAKSNFQKLSLENISLETGPLNKMRSSVLSKNPLFDFIWIDGIHDNETLMDNFNELMRAKHDQTIMIFNEIHQSAAIERAWKEMKEHAAVTLTIDLFNIGIVLFRKENKAKQHFTIRY